MLAGFLLQHCKRKSCTATQFKEHKAAYRSACFIVLPLCTSNPGVSGVHRGAVGSSSFSPPHPDKEVLCSGGGIREAVASPFSSLGFLADKENEENCADCWQEMGPTGFCLLETAA